MSDGSSRDALPYTYLQFRDRFPTVTDAHSRLGEAAAAAGPLEEKTRSLVNLGICLGAGLASAARSHARRARDAGATLEELEDDALPRIC